MARHRNPSPSSSTTDEAKAYLQQIKERGLDDRAERKAKEDYLRRLVQEREAYVEAQLSAQTKVATGYQGIYKAGISAKASLAQALIDASVRRDNAILAARASDLRSLRSALAHASASHDAKAISAVERAVQGQSQARSATGEATTSEVVQGAANQLATGTLPQDPAAGAIVRVFEQTYGDPVAAGYLRGDAAARWAQLKKQGGDSDAAAAAILALPDLDTGAATPADYDRQQKVLNDYLDKVPLDESDFDSPEGSALKEDEIVQDYDAEISRVKGELQSAVADGKLTDDERARLVADPAFQEWAKDMGFNIGTAKPKVGPDGQPLKNDAGYVLGDVSTYERGKEDDEAIDYAARQVRGDKDLPFRPPLGEVVSIKVAGPGTDEHLRWSDGKFRVARDPKSGTLTYMPPELEKQAGTAEPLLGKWTRTTKEGFPIEGYVKDPKSDDIYWVDFLAGYAKKIDIENNEQEMVNYNSDVSDKEWQPLYVPGTDGKAVPAIDPQAFAKVKDFEYSADAYGGMSPTAPKPAGLPELTATDEPPPEVHSVYTQRAPRNLMTDRRGTLRTHDQRGDHVYDWSADKGAYVERVRDFTPIEGQHVDEVTGRTTSVANPAETAVVQEEEPPELRLGRRGQLGPDEFDKPEVDRLNAIIADPEVSFGKKKQALLDREEILGQYKHVSDAEALDQYTSSPLYRGQTGADKEESAARLEKTFAENRAEDEAATAGEKSPYEKLQEHEAEQAPVQEYVKMREQEPAARDSYLKYVAAQARYQGKDVLPAVREEAAKWDKVVAAPQTKQAAAFEEEAQAVQAAGGPPVVAIQPGSPAAVKKAQEAADKWAATDSDTRSIPQAVTDIQGSTGVDRARLRAILKAAEEKAKAPPPTTTTPAPESYATPAGGS